MAAAAVFASETTIRYTCIRSSNEAHVCSTIRNRTRCSAPQHETHPHTNVCHVPYVRCVTCSLTHSIPCRSSLAQKMSPSLNPNDICNPALRTPRLRALLQQRGNRKRRVRPDGAERVGSKLPMQTQQRSQIAASTAAAATLSAAQQPAVRVQQQACTPVSEPAEDDIFIFSKPETRNRVRSVPY